MTRRLASSRRREQPRKISRSGLDERHWPRRLLFYPVFQQTLSRHGHARYDKLVRMPIARHKASTNGEVDQVSLEAKSDNLHCGGIRMIGEYRESPDSQNRPINSDEKKEVEQESGNSRLRGNLGVSIMGREEAL